jgi:hypothetical protein
MKRENESVTEYWVRQIQEDARSKAIEECAAIAETAGCGNRECRDCYGNQIAAAIRDLLPFASHNRQDAEG